MFLKKNMFFYANKAEIVINNIFDVFKSTFYCQWLFSSFSIDLDRYVRMNIIRC